MLRKVVFFIKLSNTRLFRNTNTNLEGIKILEFPDKFTIANEGDLSESIGIVLTGSVLIKSYSLSGKNFTLNTLQPGQMFGDIILYGSNEKVYPGELITQGVTRLAFIPNNEFETLLFKDKKLLRNFLRLVSEKAYNMNLKSKLLSQDSIRDKILFWIQQQRRIQNSDVIKMNITKEELANSLYIQRPSLSRELSLMKKDGLIDYDRKTITIK